MLAPSFIGVVEMARFLHQFQR